MRLFIAIDLNQQIKDKIKILQENLAKINTDIRWVKPENIHITIKFLGEVKDEKIEKISNRLKEICFSFQSFTFDINEAGSFPDWKAPRVIWLGVGSGREELTRLAEIISEIFYKEFGFKKENTEFNAHITIGRVKSFKNTEKIKEVLDTSNLDFGKVKVNEIILMKSALTPGGSVYEPISCFHLRS